MADDDKTKRGHPDRDLINTNEPYEMQQASKTTQRTQSDILKAVKAVGNGREAVYKYLEEHPEL